MKAIFSGSSSFLAGLEGSGIGSFTGLSVCDAGELLELLGICGWMIITLLSGLKISGCTLMASVTPCAAGEVAEMMAYATPGLLAAVEMPCAYKGDEQLSSCPLDSLS